MTPSDFFENLWNDYIQIAPKAKALHRLVEAHGPGERVVNDHVAFRTFDLAPINLEVLERHILALGYQRFAPYQFEEKRLRAVGYIHPQGHPRIFLSELETARCSARLREVVRGLVDQVDPTAVEAPEFLWSGRPWKPVSHRLYRELLEESEYAAWLAAIGLRANHFTISVNHLKTFDTIHALCEYLQANGYPLNTAGGTVKGSPEVLLEQASSLADQQPVEFEGGERHVIPTCYYEFARRYPDPATGRLYEGFVASSADKVFESTDVQR